MQTKNLFLIASLCGVTFLTAGCTKCHMRSFDTPEHHNTKHNKNKMHEKNKHHKKQKSTQETAVFYQNYEESGIGNVSANMYTASSNGGESEMGFINFQETNDGLQMNVDLIDLRPGKIYTAQIYQCGACNDSTCCDMAPMAIDLPTIKIDNAGRLQQTYIIRGLTATQLNNAKLILTRDGGYKAAWGTLLN